MTFLRTSFGIAISILGVSVARAESASDPNPVHNRLVSVTDQNLTIHKVGVLPVVDNINGIYGRPVENKLVDLLKASHRFEFAEVKSTEAGADDFDDKPETMKTFGRQTGVDALFVVKVFKTPRKTELIYDLFLTSDGLLLAQEASTLDSKTELKVLEKATTDAYAKLIAKIPYRGLVLSRKGNRVTLDMGTSDGVRANHVLTVEQIISTNRHPRFKFLLSNEKEIIGKIKVLKAEDTLSFGVILQEKDRGVIDKDSKISSQDFVTYAEESLNNIGPMGPMESPTAALSFGKNPQEWLPENAPTFGRVQLGLGLGTLQRAGKTSIDGVREARISVYPSIELKAELWITPNWFVATGLGQGIGSMDNAAGSQPTTVSSSITSYELRGGYRFLLQDDFFGPQVSLHAGIQKFSMFVDASSPMTFTSVAYSGIFLGVGGSLPVTRDKRWYANVELNRFFYPSLSESPVSSGASSDSSITQFSFGASYRLTTKFFVTGHMDLGFYSTTFSGSGTRTASTGVLDSGESMSVRTTQIIGGIVYLF